MTMCSHLARRFISSSFYSSPQSQNPSLLAPLLFSSLSSQTQPQSQTELPFIAQYLISSFGFSANRALKVSGNSHLTAIKSPERPEAVVKFLSDTGLTDAQIKAVVSFQPNIFGYNVDRTFKPKVRQLINAGFSRELVVQLIRYNPPVLYLKNIHSRLQFWGAFCGEGNEALLKIIPRNPILFSLDIDKQVVPVINLLKEYGLSNPDIVSLLHQGTRCMGQNLDSLRQTLQLIEQLGIPRGSIMLRRALKAVGGTSEDIIKRKVEFLKKMYGLSQEDVSTAFRKFPPILALSEENLKSKMDFLIGVAGIEPNSIASYPAIVGYSLERVLVARYNVLSALKAKGLKITCSILTVCYMSEKRFSENYVMPFEKDMPMLCQAYMAALM